MVMRRLQCLQLISPPQSCFNQSSPEIPLSLEFYFDLMPLNRILGTKPGQMHMCACCMQVT